MSSTTKSVLLLAVLSFLAVFKAGYLPRFAERAFTAAHFGAMFELIVVSQDARADMAAMKKAGKDVAALETKVTTYERDLAAGIGRWKRGGDRSWIPALAIRGEDIRADVLAQQLAMR